MTTPAPAAAPPPPPPPPNYQLVQTVPTRHRHHITAVAFAPNRTCIATASADSSARIWRLSTDTVRVPGEPVQPIDAHAPLHTLVGYHKRGINDIAWSKDSRLLCTASEDGKLAIWDVETGAALRDLVGHEGPVTTTCFSPQNHILASGSYDEKIHIWDYRTNVVVKKLAAHSDPVTAVDFSHDGHRLVSGGYDGAVHVFESNLWERTQTLFPDGSTSAIPVTRVRFSPNGRVVLASYLDHRIRLWTVTDRKIAKRYTGHVNKQYAIDSMFLVRNCTPSQNCVISGSENGALFIWKLNERDLVQRIDLPNSSSNSAASAAASSSPSSQPTPTPMPLCLAVHTESPFILCAPTHSNSHLFVYQDVVAGAGGASTTSAAPQPPASSDAAAA